MNILQNFYVIAVIKYTILALIFIGIGKIFGYNITISLIIGFTAALVLYLINYYSNNTNPNDYLSIDNT